MLRKLLFILLIPLSLQAQDTLEVRGQLILNTVYDTTVVYDTTDVESLALRNVNYGYNQTGSTSLSYAAEAHGDSVLFEYFANGVQLKKSLQIPNGGVVRDTLKDPPLDSIQVWIHGYWDKWVEPFHEIVNTALLDTLGGADTTSNDSTMATLVNDTFTDTNGTSLDAHTPDTDTVGTGWVLTDLFAASSDVPDATIQSNQANFNSNSTGAVIDAGASDVTIEVDWTPTPTTSRAAIAYRYVDDQNHMLFTLRDANSDVGFTRVQNDAQDFNFQSAAFTFNNGQTYTIRLEVTQTGVTAYIDNTQVLSTTDTTHSTATSHGLGRATASGPEIFDNFTISGTGGTTVEMGFSVGASSGVATTGGATAESSFAVNQSSGISQDGAGTGEGNITINKSLGIASAGDASIEGAVTVSKVLQALMSGDATTDMSFTTDLVHSVSVTLDETTIVDMSFTAGLQHAIASSSDATINVSYSLPASLTQQIQSTATAEGNMQMNMVAAVSILGDALSEVGISMDAVQSITIDASAVTSTVTLADGRTFTITLENRTFTIPDENRTFTIASEDRTYEIE